MLSAKRILQSLLIMIIFILPLSPSDAQAKELDDPILEYSYHLKMDLSVIKSYVDRIFDTSKLDDDVAMEVEKIYQGLLNSGLCDLDEITMDCRFDKDMIFGKAMVSFQDTLAERGALNDFIISKPRMSMVRALVPEEDTIAWLTLMEPLKVKNIVHCFMEQCEIDKKKSHFGHCDAIKGQCQEIEKLIGDELNVIISDLKIPMMGDPIIKGGLVLSMADGVTKQDMNFLANFLDNLLVEESMATKKVSKWNSFDVVTYEDLDLGDNINPSFIIDKYYFIMASDIQTLEMLADHVLNPKRTASSKALPPVMNGMATLNVNKLMTAIPDGAFMAMSMMTDDDPHKGNIRDMIKNEDWGVVRFVRTHTPDGVLLSCSMNRSIYSLLYHVSIETMIMSYSEAFKYIYKAKEAEVKSNIHSIQIAIERHYVDFESYPPDSHALIEKGYLDEFPFNPYTDEPMIECGFPGSPGDFIYFPIFDDANEKVIGYKLIGFGRNASTSDKINNELLAKEGVIKEESDGEIDRVLIVLGSAY